MRSAIRIFMCAAAVMFTAIVLTLSPGQSISVAATRGSDLTVDQILEQVEAKYANSKFSADFIQKRALPVISVDKFILTKFFFFLRFRRGL